MLSYERKRVGTGSFGKKLCEKCGSKLKQETQYGILKTFAWIKNDSIVLCDSCYDLEANQCKICKKYFETYTEYAEHRDRKPSQSIYVEHQYGSLESQSYGSKCDRCNIRESIIWEAKKGDNYHYGYTICDSCYDKLDPKYVDSGDLDWDEDSTSEDWDEDST